MNNKNILLVGISIAIISLVACTSRYETDLVKKDTAPCDSLGSYLKVQAIINAECAECHTASVTSGLPYTSYNEVKSSAGSILSRCELPTSDPSFMPLSGNRLSDCNLKVIRKWIEAGTPNK